MDDVAKPKEGLYFLQSLLKQSPDAWYASMVFPAGDRHRVWVDAQVLGYTMPHVHKVSVPFFPDELDELDASSTNAQTTMAGSEVMNLSTVNEILSRQPMGNKSRNAPMILISGFNLLDQPSKTMVVTTTVLTMPFKLT